MGSTGPLPVIFLDRDGVLIENRDAYVRTWDDVQIFPQAEEACRILSDAGYPLVVVTNQAVIGRGLLSYDDVVALNNRIVKHFILAGANIQASYLCHHHPDEGCDCRKPKPGMLLLAAHEHNIDLTNSYLVGDAITDLQAADAAGVKGILVRTGRGVTQEPLIIQEYDSRWQIEDDLLAVATFLLTSNGGRG